MTDFASILAKITGGKPSMNKIHTSELFFDISIEQEVDLFFHLKQGQRYKKIKKVVVLGIEPRQKIHALNRWTITVSNYKT